MSFDHSLWEELEMLEAMDVDADFPQGVRDELGAWQLGRLEEDPEMDAYEDMLALGQSLRRRRG
jgi:hypothetical protein